MQTDNTINLPLSVILDSKLIPSEKMILSYLYYICQKEGKCMLTDKKIGDIFGGMNYRAINRAIGIIECNELIKIDYTNSRGSIPRSRIITINENLNRKALS